MVWCACGARSQRALITLGGVGARCKRSRHRVLTPLARNLLISMDYTDKLAFPPQFPVSCELADTESGLMTSHCPQTDVFSRSFPRAGAVLSVFWHRGAAV